ncbi:FAD-binding oxidoreductase [Endozoicomonas sp. SM1973]|uniref:FAD-binding oxidoreductase n=1 Tax=Spartinivicinus marinus TaxID=2994442 RepID=A0A853I781_9GAMM|nr:FAD-dependent oxidoreductase [Spartinivicinus marinus]MCX4029481.1 FAD-dependent oxidoreductase [Spartinivicinus marinus]NYZ65055.1 FAD-binding oxidoreductase [Spartinivicinus marinus]
MEQQTTIDVAVVGAGIVGICCACYLKQAGLNVLLLDRQPPAEGASKGNAGHFATEQVLPLASPHILTKIPAMLLNPLGPVAIQWQYLPQILPWLMRFIWQSRMHTFKQNMLALQALNEEALTAYRPLLKAAKIEHLVNIHGSMVVFESQAAFAANQAQYQLMAAHGVIVNYLTAEEVRALEPLLSKQVTAGVLFPNTGHTINPYRLAIDLYDYYRKIGGHFQCANVTALYKTADGCVIHVQPRDYLHSQKENSQYQVRRLVLTTGAWSKQWVQQLTGIKVPLDTERGYHLMVPGANQMLKMAVSSGERKFIMTPMEAGLRLAGTVEFAGLQRPANMKRADMLLQHAKALIPELPNQPGERWMGFRPSLPDSLPVIDQIGPIYFAFGHQHLGLTQAAITGQLIKEMIQGVKPSINLTPYRITRFGGSCRD